MAEYEDARTRVVAIEELADLLELIHATAAVHWASGPHSHYLLDK